MTSTMDAARMRPEDVASCRWIGYAMLKGVTHPVRNVSAWGREDGPQDSGLHGTLVQQFGGVDPTPRCYEPDAPIGFDGFVRWVRFTSPTTEHRVFGVDFSVHERPGAGVARSMLDLVRVAHVAHAHGVPDLDELALLAPHMCEPPGHEAWRREHKLVSVQDWRRAWTQFAPPTALCPACGHTAFSNPAFHFCSHCGSDPHYTWRTHGLEE